MGLAPGVAERVVGGVGELDRDRRRVAGAEEDEDLLAHLGHDVALPRHVGERAREVEGERLQRVERAGLGHRHMLAHVTPVPRPPLTSLGHDRRMTEDTPPITRRKRRLAAGAAVLGAGALLAGPITAFAQQDDDDTETETETDDRGPRRLGRRGAVRARHRRDADPGAGRRRRRGARGGAAGAPVRRRQALAWRPRRPRVRADRAGCRGRGHRHRGGRPPRRAA